MNLLPKDEKFFDLFVEQANILKKAASALHEGVTANGDLDRRAQEIGNLEKEGDGKLHDILDRLNRTFITPIDPEDISQVATSVENLLDQIENLSFRFSAVSLDPLPAPLGDLTKQFDDASGLIVQLFEKFQHKQMDEKDAVREDCEKIRGLASDVIRHGREQLRDLFRKETDALALIKHKDIYDCLDTTARRFDQFTDVIQNVIAKNT